MPSSELSWRQLEKWSPLGIYSAKPKLGPGGWSAHSYFMEEIGGANKGKHVAWAKSSATGFDWVFDVMRDHDVAMSRVNMFYARDKDCNPRLNDHYYAFFETLPDAMLFRTYLEDYPQDLADRSHHMFFKYLNDFLPADQFERR